MSCDYVRRNLASLGVLEPRFQLAAHVPAAFVESSRLLDYRLPSLDADRHHNFSILAACTVDLTKRSSASPVTIPRA